MQTLRTLVVAAIALAGGAWIGYADSRSDDVFITLGMLFGFSLLLGVAGPRRAWLWPLLVATWVPVLDVALPRLGFVPVRPGEHYGILSALAVTALTMAVSLAGSYGGAALAKAIGGAKGHREGAPDS